MTSTTTDSSDGPKARRIVVMGVAGSGKTTVGERLAEELGSSFFDADAAHPPRNIAKMSAGIPLTDTDRLPWLARLERELADSDDIVITCSALKRDYRNLLRRAGSVRFVFLEIGPDTALRRITTRTDHFMGSNMVESQFEALEPPSPVEADVITLSGDDEIEAIVQAAVERLGARP